MGNPGWEKDVRMMLPGGCVQGDDMKKFPKAIREQLKRTLDMPDNGEERPAAEALPAWEYTLYVHNSRGTKLSHEELMVELSRLGTDGWEHYDSYPDTRNRDMRLYHFKRHVR